MRRLVIPIDIGFSLIFAVIGRDDDERFIEHPRLLQRAC